MDTTMYGRVIRRATLSVLTASAVAAFVPQMAYAAAPFEQTIVLTPSSGCGLLTEYTTGTGLSDSSGPAPTCGEGPFTLAFDQGNIQPPALSRGVATAGSALLAWLSGGVPDGARMGYRITAPPGIAINKVVYDIAQLQNIADGHGWIGLTYWNGGTAQVQSPGTAVDTAVSGASLDTNLDTTYWGIELRCVESVCTMPGKIELDQFQVSASETQGPSITPTTDPTSLWNQHGWVWNPPGDAWQLPLAATDPGGICSLAVQPGASPPVADPSLPAPSGSSWQECQPASWTAAVDTRDYIGGAGQLPVSLQATNGAGLTNAPMSETLNVDNDPVSVSLSTPDDPNPTVWVNHAVTVNATPSTGLSGLGGLTCSVDGGSAQSYPASGLTVDGDGFRTVSCTVWNNAVDPQGEHNSSTSTVTLHIDESPPSISFEPENPADPTGVVVDTSDAESGVAGGSIEMAPAGTNEWTSLPARLDGSQLMAHFDDAGLTGVWQLAARSCDNVGNCASTTRTLTLPVRDGAVAQVSLQGVNRCAATKRADRSVVARSKHPSRHHMIAAHPRPTRDSSSTTARSTAGAALLSASRMIRRSAAPRKASIRRRARSGRARGVLVGAAVPASVRAPASPCVPGARAASGGEVPYGSPVTVRGRLMDSQGQPLAAQTVSILIAPDNGSNAFTPAGAVTTAADGSWMTTLPAGPSRIIQASYAGSATVLPASGYATVVTPARIRITRVTPDRVGWGHTVTISGRVLGGYVPASSKLLRLDLGIVGIRGSARSKGFRTSRRTARSPRVTSSRGGLSGVARFWLQVSSLPEAEFHGHRPLAEGDRDRRRPHHQEEEGLCAS